MKYKVTITKTSDGLQEYMQIIAADQFSTNIVLIGEFEVQDSRQARLSHHNGSPLEMHPYIRKGGKNDGNVRRSRS
jgi:hypothetical protein